MSEGPVIRTGSEPVRALVAAVHAAVAAAQAGDRDAFDAAVGQLGRGGARRPDPEQVAVVLGLLLGDVLERVHPDGIDSDDAEQAVERCLRTARPWYPQVEEDHLIRALAGALRIDTYAGPDAVTVGDRAALTAHGVLLVADLLDAGPSDALRPGAGRDSLGPLLDAVLAELRRAETMELP